jgi:hypothetical protein
MSDPKHTPGPWELIGTLDDDDCRVRQSASVREGDGFYSETTICEQIGKMANAKLIAAAPELLEALIESRQVIATALQVGAPDWFDSDEKVAQHTTVKKIDAAIAKATA